MGLGSLWDRALSETPRISLLSEACLRTRFRQSTCRRCVEVCADNAISLDPGPTITNACSGCGLCQNACPTEVFRSEWRTDDELLSQAAAIHGRDDPPAADKRLFIHCRQAEIRSAPALSVPCLGGVSENVIIGAALRGFDGTVLVKGLCSRCRQSRGEQLLAHTMRISRALLDGLGLQAFSMSVWQEGKRTAGAPVSRRELLSSVVGSVRRAGAEVAGRPHAAVSEGASREVARDRGAGHLPKRRVLRRLLEHRERRHAIVARYGPEFPWGRLTIEGKKCSACGMCVAVCPTGALLGQSDGPWQRLTFNGGACSNCALCRDVCPEQAIGFDEVVTLSDVLSDEARVVARVRVTSCVLCGEAMAAEGGGVCTVCQKRQLWSANARV